jgi:hypothetical protein
VEGYDEKSLYDQWQISVDARARERADRKGTDVGAERQGIMDAYARSAKSARKRKKSKR